MSKCPFWSMKKQAVSCYNECPMHSTVSEDESCPFKQVLNETKISYKDIVNEKFSYSQEKKGEYDFLQKAYSY
ncbi:MAG: hypothetical protein ACRC68_03415 [Clostridium sp.]